MQEPTETLRRPGEGTDAAPATRTYTVLFAQDVPHYGAIEIKAPGAAAALETARLVELNSVDRPNELYSGHAILREGSASPQRMGVAVLL